MICICIICFDRGWFIVGGIHHENSPVDSRYSRIINLGWYQMIETKTWPPHGGFKERDPRIALELPNHEDHCFNFILLQRFQGLSPMVFLSTMGASCNGRYMIWTLQGVPNGWERVPLSNPLGFKHHPLEGVYIYIYQKPLCFALGWSEAARLF